VATPYLVRTSYAANPTSRAAPSSITIRRDFKITHRFVTAFKLIHSMNPHIPTTMINFLPGNILLEIFELFRMDEAEATAPGCIPWKWHRLAHVSRTVERHHICVITTKNLAHLPAHPVVIHFASPFRVEDSDEDSLLAALEHSGRVCRVELHVSCSLLRKKVGVQ
ncbi:hypothetical protein H4582DRAFT_1938469, partial [Lactarius indigo]